MAITVKHKFVSAIPDAGDPTIVQPSNWNDTHDLVGTVPVANGGTGAATLTGYVIGNGTSAMTASTTIPSGDVSGLGTMATQNANAIAVTGGTVNGTTIGATTASTGAFTYLSTSSSTSITPTLSFNASNSPYAAGATITGSYLQHLLQNKSGTAGASTNYVLSNDLGTDSSYYGEFGMNSSVYSAGTPADFFSINNGIYYSGHDGDVTVGSGNGYKTYLAWGTTGQSAHVINATGSIGLNTNATGTTNYGTSGQMLLSAGSAATPTWSNAPTITGGTIDNTVIGGTTPAAGTFTTITGQTEVLKGTGENLLTYSQLIGGTNWTLVGSSTVVTNAVSAPDSTTTASTLSNPSGGYVRGFNGVNILTNISYTFSCYVKASASGGASNVRLTTNNQAAWNTGLSTKFALTSSWQRVSISGSIINAGTSAYLIIGAIDATGTNDATCAGNVDVWGAQLEIGSILNTYVSTTSAIVYGTPLLSFSGVAGLGLQSDGSLYVSPAGTGALQAQATTSTATGGNARGANAVDWQTVRTGAAQVASGVGSVITGGQLNTSNGYSAVVSGGYANTSNSAESFVGAGSNNSIGSNGQFSAIVGGAYNTANGYYNFIGAGFTNSGTASAAVTTNTTTIAVSASTTIYLSSTNANIKVGQYISGTGVTANTYATSTVTTGTAAVMNTSTISGTTLTVGSLASGTIIAGMVLTGTGVTAGTYIVSGSASTWTVSTSQTVASTTITGTAYTFTISQNATTTAGITLSFYTPHGVVVGGGNNQATGAYSFIGGGGDAGTAANRNTASGDWSFVGGGWKNTASGAGSVVVGGGNNNGSAFANLASGLSSFIGSGVGNTTAGINSFIGSGYQNSSSGDYSAIMNGVLGTTRSIVGNQVSSACNNPLGSGAQGTNQSSLLVLGVATTDATATVLRSNSSAAGTTNQVILPNNSAYAFTATVISTANFALATTATAGSAGTATITFATQTVAPFVVGQTIVVAGITPTGYNGTQTVTACTTTTVQYTNATTGAQTVAGTITATSLTKAWKLEGCIMRTSAVGGTRLVGSVTSTVLATDTGTAAWTAVAAADTTNGGLKITFTGAAATTIRTVAQVQTTEVTY
jgi:hypothetical protein